MFYFHIACYEIYYIMLYYQVKFNEILIEKFRNIFSK